MDEVPTARLFFVTIEKFVIDAYARLLFARRRPTY